MVKSSLHQKVNVEPELSQREPKQPGESSSFALRKKDIKSKGQNCVKHTT